MVYSSDRTIARKSSTGGFTFVPGGGLTFKFDKNSTNLAVTEPSPENHQQGALRLCRGVA